ncbi:MAG TPA: flagellar motor protein MotB [Alphaproteobacteria bacterium]|jgi:chemotaxis protein MotB
MSAPQAKAGTKAKGPPPPIIIVKRVKKHGGHEGSHGAWKVAYADFVTAMMAFFLLLWLLNATTEEQRQGISNYFAPESVSYTKSGAGGVLGGLEPTKSDGVGESRAVRIMQAPVPRRTEGKDDAEIEREHGSIETQEEAPQDYEARRREIEAAEARRLAAELEEREFIIAEENLRKSIEAVPELQAFADNLMIDRTPEGLRIQLVDQSKTAMFPRGSAVMYDHTRELLRKVAEVIRRQTQPVSVAGHTDATPYADPTGYSNWELSADRANASRRVLIDAGVPADRITQVVGKADRDPLIEDNPTDPRNRRITIILLRQARFAAPDPAVSPLPPETPAAR